MKYPVFYRIYSLLLVLLLCFSLSGCGSKKSFKSYQGVFDVRELIHDQTVDVIVLVFVKHFMLLLLMSAPERPPREHTVFRR